MSYTAYLPQSHRADVDTVQIQSADQDSATFERLRRPLRIFGLSWWRFTLTRWALATIGRLSHGIRLGWDAGFDSGRMLDYVYENEARGVGFLGRWIDRMYLDSPGWRGIRLRKAHLELMLHRGIDRLHRQGRTVHIMDIASGPGRYLLESLQDEVLEGSTVRCRDRQESNLAQGRVLAETLGYGVQGARIIHEQADAFDLESYRGLDPAPNLVVASGLYELFADNATVMVSLHGIADALQDDGLLIYTNQIWHPDLELIARTLRNHVGERWVMRCRSQEEMDALVEAAGFEKVAMNIDHLGMFSVSLARRREDAS